MKYKTLLALALVLGIVLTACAPQATEVPAMTTAPTMAATEPAATEPSATEETAVASPSAEATNTGAAETPTAGVPVTGAATVSVSESTDFGPVLVDGDGFSLYAFMKDTQNGDTSACTDADGCSTDWPPFLTDGDPVAGEGVDATLLGTITREDGTTQVTYNGWPLYRYHEDTATGDTNGQGLEEFGGLWYLVSPAGEAVQP